MPTHAKEPEAAVQKVCRICGEDCAGRPRVRGSHGEYYCDSCYRRASRQRRSSLGSLRDYWSLLRKRRITVVVVFVIVTTTVIAGSFTIPPVYTAQTTIMIKHGREFYYRAPAGEVANASLFSLKEMVNSEVEILRSRSLAEQVISQLGLDYVYPDMLAEEAESANLLAAAAARFQDSVVVMDVLESSIIRVTLDHVDPRVAADALNLLVDKFKDKHVEIFSDAKGAFISDQLAGYEGRLSESENAMRAFRQANGVYNIAEQESLLLHRRMQLDTELNDTEFRISEVEQQLVFLNGKASSEEPIEPPPYITQDRVSLMARASQLSTTLQQAEMRLAELRHLLVVFRDRMREQDEGIAPLASLHDYRAIEEAFIRLLDLQLREKELLRDYNESNRQVVSVRNEIKMVEAFLAMRGSYVQEVLETTIQDEMEGLVARRAVAIEQIEQLETQIRAWDMRLALDELAPLHTRRNRIVHELVELESEIRELDHYEKDYRQLERAVALDERNYQAFMDVSEEARIMEELDRMKLVNIAVIERAVPPIDAGGLSKKMRVIIGAFVGLFGGAAAAVFMELVRG
jgi:uncharacterized protein involved in exopolysaccharide biosynthesis